MTFGHRGVKIRVSVDKKGAEAGKKKQNIQWR